MHGTDSPVNMASLTIHVPFKRIRSQGNTVFSGTSIISPGTNSSELTYFFLLRIVYPISCKFYYIVLPEFF